MFKTETPYDSRRKLHYLCHDRMEIHYDNKDIRKF